MAGEEGSHPEREPGRPGPRGGSAPPPLEPDPRYARLPTDGQLNTAARHLRDHGFEVVVVTSLEEARRELLARVPPGSEILDAASRTLEETGILKALADRPDITLLKRRLHGMDRRTQADEIRRLSQAPGVVIGSVHAVTESGELLVASATGVQIGPYAFGAGRVIWVVGTQKVVPTIAEGLDRIERYSFPLEDARARKVYGGPSAVNRLLLFRREHQPGRSTIILVKQNVGF